MGGNTASSSASVDPAGLWFLLASLGEFTMSILDEREPTVSLKLVIALVSLVTIAAFACLFAMHASSDTKPATATSPTAAPVQTQAAEAGNI